MAQNMTVTLKLTADASGLKAEIGQASKEFANLGTGGNRAAVELRSGLDGAGGAATRLRGAIQGLGAEVGGLRAALAGLAAAFGAREVVQTAMAYDRFQRSLQAATGDAAGAKREMEFVRRQADLLGMRVTDLAGSWATFLGAVRGTAVDGQVARNVFIGVASAASAMGLSSEDARGALLALSQMAGKGVVSAEELRGQLGERMPAAIRLLAQSLGVSIEKLNEMLEKGQLTAEVVFPRLASALQNEYGAAAIRASNDAGAAFARAQNAFDELATTLARSGLMDGLATAANALRDSFADPQMQAGARALGEGIGNAIRLMVENAGTIIQVAAALRGAAMGGRAGAAIAGGPGAVVGGVAGGAAGYYGAGAAMDALTTRGQQRQLEAEVAQLRERIRATESRGELGLADPGRNQAALDRLRSQLAAAEQRLAAVGTRPGEGPGLYGPPVPPAVNPDFDTTVTAPRIPPASAGGGGGRGDDERRRLMAEGNRLNERLRTPYEDMQAQLERYREMLTAGAIDQETFNRAVRSLDEEGRAPFDRLMASLDPVQGVLRDYAAQQETIRAALERGAIAEDEYTEAVRRTSEALGDRLQRARADADGTTEAQRRVQDAAQSLGLTFASGFEEAIIQGKGLSDILKGIEQDLIRIAVRKAITEPLGGAIASGIGGLLGGGGAAAGGAAASGGGGLFGGLFSLIGSLFHTGGVVGADAAPGRKVPASVFLGAPRYHSGGVIGDGEVPAILKRGEGVFTPEQMKRLAPIGDAMPGGGGRDAAAAVVNLNISVPVAAGGVDDGAQRAELAQMVGTIVIREIGRATPLIVETTKGSIRGDVRRQGLNRALGG